MSVPASRYNFPHSIIKGCDKLIRHNGVLLKLDYDKINYCLKKIASVLRLRDVRFENTYVRLYLRTKEYTFVILHSKHNSHVHLVQNKIN